MSDIHLDNWLKRVDIDFYIMFIQTWIPFNAWYNKNFYDENNNLKSDRELIDYIKRNDNPYKNRIKNLILGNTTESIEFKNRIKKIHEELELHSLPSEEKRIKLSSINLYSNPKKDETIEFNKKIYKFEYLHQQPRNTKRFKCTILKNNASQLTVGLIDIFTCNNVELEQHEYFQNQNTRVREIIKKGFNEINPQKAINIISQNNKGIKIAVDLFFIDNIELITQVIVELIYQLRCKIFHGELNPNQNYSVIYENAYNIQKQLVKSLN